MAEESKGTVLVALAANAVIALAKFTGGFLTGSAALLSEGAHSVADTVNEAFLLTAVVRSRRPPDPRHPFGYGQERFFWSLLAAVGILVLGGGFSLLEAYRSFTTSESTHGNYFLIAYVILGVSFAAEGTSFAKAVRQIRGEAAAAGRGIVAHIRLSSDPSVKTVATEDSAALVGLLLAFVGILLHQVTGSDLWEGVASLCIGLLLFGVAFALGNDVKGLLIGESADPRLRSEIAEYLQGYDDIDRVVDLLTMHMGADQILLAARVDLARRLSSDDVEALSAQIDGRLRERWPQVQYVFLDPTGESEPVEPIGLPDG
jgi:cation diffusion facilitator family transporter